MAEVCKPMLQRASLRSCNGFRYVSVKQLLQLIKNIKIDLFFLRSKYSMILTFNKSDYSDQNTNYFDK